MSGFRRPPLPRVGRTSFMYGPLETSLNDTKCSIDEKNGNFDHFWSNLTTFDTRRDFRFGPRGEIFFLNIAKRP